MGIRRRAIWLAASLAVFAAVIGSFYVIHSGITVAVYNNTSHLFRRVTVAVGDESHASEGLDCRESIAFTFKAPDHSRDVRLIVDSDAPVIWHAPALASSKVASITLRVDDYGGVTMSVENSWGFTLSRLLD